MTSPSTGTTGQTEWAVMCADGQLSLEQRANVALWAKVTAYGPTRGAVRDVIALVREQLAQDIEAERISNAINVGPDAQLFNEALDLAAKIARGGSS